MAGGGMTRLRLGFPVKVDRPPRPEKQRHPPLAGQPAPEAPASEYVDAILDHLDKPRHPHVSHVLRPRALTPPTPTCRSSMAWWPKAPLELARVRAPRPEAARHPPILPPLPVHRAEQPRPRAGPQKSAWDLVSQAEMLDRMGLDDEGGHGRSTSAATMATASPAGSAGPGSGPPCRSRCAAAWCWSTTTSGSARRTCCGSMSRPACG